MSIVTITTPFNIDLEFETAAFNKRFMAWLIDILMVCAYNYVLVYFVLRPLELDDDLNNILFILLLALPSFLYHLLFETFFNGQSVGKKVAGIKVISHDGNEATFSQYLTRWLLGFGNYIMYAMPYIVREIVVNPAYIFFLIFVLFFYLPDIISFGVSSKSQRLGDLAAGTVVIDNRYNSSINETIYLEIEGDNYTPLYPEVMRLTDRDINGIRNLLDTKSKGKDNYAYTVQVATRIKEVLGIQSDLESSAFLYQLLRDYNYLTSK